MIAVCSWVPKSCPSVVMQLQTDAVMEHTMKIVETEKYSGIRVKCFHSWILKPLTEVWQFTSYCKQSHLETLHEVFL